MNLLLLREPSTEKSTSGTLHVDGVHECFALEDIVRDEKIAGQTAIPAGTYNVVLSMSNRFHRIMPEVLHVPGFTGIRIHSGNTETETEGCILVGKNRGPDHVLESRLAFAALFEKLAAAKEPITIEIRNAPPMTAATAVTHDIAE